MVMLVICNDIRKLQLGSKLFLKPSDVNMCMDDLYVCICMFNKKPETVIPSKTTMRAGCVAEWIACLLVE